MKTILDRPIEGGWPCLRTDATCVKARQNGRIASVADIVVVGAKADGRREVLGPDFGPSEAETFWNEFLRGPRGVKLAISGGREGSNAAVSKVMNYT